MHHYLKIRKWSEVAYKLFCISERLIRHHVYETSGGEMTAYLSVWHKVGWPVNMHWQRLYV